MKTFCFTVDDNIRFLKEITERNYNSIFEHPYLAMYKRLHETFDLQVQLNLFYWMEGFDLSQMGDQYRKEWEENAHWLKLSFHSDYENVKPYEFSGYEEVYTHCKQVNEQILRFAGPSSLGKTTTIHYCVATEEGLRAMADNENKGLLGLYGTDEKPRVSYGIAGESAAKMRRGQVVYQDGIAYAAIDIVLNGFSTEEILAKLAALQSHEMIRVMIHEQYFYEDYPAYQPEFEEKLAATFAYLTQQGYKSVFFEQMI